MPSKTSSTITTVAQPDAMTAKDWALRSGRTIAVAAGYSWAATSELKQLWVDEAYRGRGYARGLLERS